MKTSLKAILCVTLLAVASFLSAQAPDWLWVAQSQGANAEQGNAIVCDANGNSYVAGYFEGTATLGTTTLISNGSNDLYAAKLDPDGNWLWAVQAGGAGEDVAYGIALDNDGTVYLTGFFSQTATFGSITLVSSGSTELFAAKLNNNGNWLWAVQAGGAAAETGTGIAVDADANVYLTGIFAGTATFGTTSLISLGLNDIFAAKLDGSGNWLWAVSAGSTNLDEAHGIALDGDGNAYITGIFRLTATFGTISVTCNGRNDVFAAKLDSTGNWLWVANGGGDHDTYADNANGIAVDAASNVYLTGEFFATATFGTSTFTSSGGRDIYIAKLDGNGNWLWADKAGGINSDSGSGIATDSASAVYVTGYYQSNINLGPFFLGGIGLSDIFIAKLDNAGNWQWAMRAGSPLNDYGRGIAVDEDENVYLHGAFSGVANFGDFSLTASSFDLYVAKLSGAGVETDDPLVPELPAASCLHDAWPNPARPGATLHFKAVISRRETGNLAVYNLRGQCLANYRLGSGIHQIELGSGDLPSGIYFYQLKTPSVNQVKRLVLFR